MKVILSKILSTHENLRTDVIKGNTLELPEIGLRFMLTGESLDNEMDVRVVLTSKVVWTSHYCDNEGNQSIKFATENSTYNLEVLHEQQEEETNEA